MRHLKRGYRIGTGKDHRRSLLRSLIVALIDHHKVTTTLAKAKTLKAYFDKMVNLAKKDDLYHTRLLISRLGNNPSAAFKLKKEILPKLRPVKSGYTSLKRAGRRQGDNTVLARLSILFAPVKAENTKAKAKAKPVKKTTSAGQKVKSQAKKTKVKTKKVTK